MQTLALPSRGRLSSGALALLDRAGIKVARSERVLQTYSQEHDINIFFLHHKDCGKFVEEGWVDVGVTAQDVLSELGSKVAILTPLNFGNCRLVVAVHEQSEVRNIKDLENATIATKYPQISSRWFSNRNVTVNIRYLHGAIEISPALGYADAIVDSYQTGATARANQLIVLETIMNSEAVLICSDGMQYSPEIRSLTNLLKAAAYACTAK
jgi:ATP phosphoribosyltransferase